MGQPYRLGQLWLKNYRSFETEKVEFKPKGMTLIRGFNRDTGGSSYAGKSSLPVAIAIAMGYSPFSIKDQQTWGVKSGLSISQELITDQGTWIITRGSKTTLKPPSGETITGAAAVDQKLREITGVPPEILAALTYRKQGARGLFLTKTDAEKKEFLTLVLGLGAFEQAGEEAAKNAAAAELRLAAAKAGLARVEAQIRSISTADAVLVDVAPLERQVADGLKSEADLKAIIIEAESKIAALEADCKARVAKVEAQYRDRLAEAAEALVAARVPPVLPKVVADPKLIADLDEAKKRLARRVEADDVLRKEFDVQCRAIDTEIFNLKGLIADSGRLKAEAAELKKKIASAEGSKCPTCGEQWLKAKEQLTAWKARLLRVEFDISTAAEAVASMPMLEAKRAELVFVPDPKIEQFRAIVTQLTSDVASSRLASENAVKQAQAEHAVNVSQKQAAVSALSAEQAQAVATVRAELDKQVREQRDLERAARLKLATATAGLQQAQMQLKATDIENQQRVREHQQRQEQLAELGDELTEAQGAVDLEEHIIKSERDFEVLVGYKGFLGVIFDEILAEITEETNAILGAVANTAHVTVHFTSEVVTQKTGAGRKEIRPIVTIGGFQAPLESGASGGMLTSIDLAVDLAVATVVSKRTNSWPGWMVLDESFNGMDAVTKETCMEMLARYAEDRLILVVDHASETKELFSDFIDVEFKNGRSRIVESK